MTVKSKIGAPGRGMSGPPGRRGSHGAASVIELYRYGARRGGEARPAVRFGPHESRAARTAPWR